MTWKTPLPYMGGKQRAVRKLAQFIPDGITQIGSPFFGGGSFEAYLAASRGINIIAADAFAPLVNFWQWLFKDPQTLSTELTKLIPVETDAFFKIREELKEECLPTITNAAKIYILYNAGFSNAIRGGHSPKQLNNNNKRNWRGQRAALRNFRTKADITIKCQDVFDFLEEHPNLYCYFDPPYLDINSTGGYYGFDKSMHEDFDHERFANTLRNTNRQFLLSYLDCPEIREMYQWANIHETTWRHSSKTNARKNKGRARESGKELAITP